jgi:hypothetical protein
LSRHGVDRISLIYYPTSVFRRHYRERALFIAHLKKEGVALTGSGSCKQCCGNLSFPSLMCRRVSDPISPSLLLTPIRCDSTIIFCSA